tara:strand:+ start:68 stop:556 length:489 start_codon:yes stop_codon:yes gene_type:complete
MASTLTVDNIVGATSASAVHLPGHVIQVVQNVVTGQVSTGGTSYVNTGLTATITPKYSNSKVLVIVGQPMSFSTATNSSREGYWNICRGTTQLIEGGSAFDLTENNAFQITAFGNNLTILDSPATTNATTYKTQMMVSAGTCDIYVGYGNTSGSMVLMEIAQ